MNPDDDSPDDEIPIAEMAARGGAFDYLADEPDLYSDADLIERNEDFVVTDDKPTLRQRLLVRIGNIATMLEELGHLPADRLLAVDVSMTEAEHIEWLRRMLAEADGSEEVDGETAIAEIRRERKAKAEKERERSVIYGSGTAAEIADRIARLSDGHYRFRIERMPSKEEVVERVDGFLSESQTAVAPELVGKTDDEIQEMANTVVDEVRTEMRAERLKTLRRFGLAHHAGMLPRDEFLLLAYELVLSRFGADR